MAQAVRVGPRLADSSVASSEGTALLATIAAECHHVHDDDQWQRGATAEEPGYTARICVVAAARLTQ